jgi:hypothetical protein
MSYLWLNGRCLLLPLPRQNIYSIQENELRHFKKRKIERSGRHSKTKYTSIPCLRLAIALSSWNSLEVFGI